MIPVTKTFLPPLADYVKYLEKIWENGWITNNGEMLNLLEKRLSLFFQNPNFCLVNNGTVALQIAIKAFDLKGEIITTPFSYVATTSSIFWEGCKPVFADVDDETFTINPQKIEDSITSKTSAIIATHVYGNPCDIEAIDDIAKRKGLKVIYDAAHCFGVKYKDKPIANYGDASILSFHATKLFHTVEGGALLTPHTDIFERFMFMRNFGHNGEEKFFGPGINGKNSEVHAAMGLCVLDNIDKILEKRKFQYLKYLNFFKDYTDDFQLIKIRDNTDYNYAYFPLVFPDEKSLLSVKKQLNDNDIFPRHFLF
jgi:dTDP-4-amino-4,6-dideoxygalactose transaminase